MSTVNPEVITKIKKLIQINTELKTQAEKAINKWTIKLQPNMQPNVTEKIKKLIQINTELKTQAEQTINKWNKKLEKMSVPTSDVPAAASATVEPEKPVTPVKAVTQISEKHKKLLEQCGFITK